MATHHTLVTPEAASTAALTRAISPGSGTPRLSTQMTPATSRYTTTGGRVPSQCCTWSTGTTPRNGSLSIYRVRPAGRPRPVRLTLVAYGDGPIPSGQFRDSLAPLASQR